MLAFFPVYKVFPYLVAVSWNRGKPITDGLDGEQARVETTMALITGSIPSDQLTKDLPRIRTNVFNVKAFFLDHPGEKMTISGLREAGFSKRIYDVINRLAGENWLARSADERTGKNYYFLPDELMIRLGSCPAGGKIAGLRFNNRDIEFQKLVIADHQLVVMLVPRGWELVVHHMVECSNPEAYPCRFVLSDLEETAGTTPIFCIKLPLDDYQVVFVDGKARVASVSRELSVEHSFSLVARDRGFSIQRSSSGRSVVFTPRNETVNGTKSLLQCGIGYLNGERWKKENLAITVPLLMTTEVELFPRERMIGVYEH